MDDAARDVAAAPSVIDAVRRAAHTSQSTFADNDCIHRFLRAYDGDTEKAAAALSRTLFVAAGKATVDVGVHHLPK